ncbi:head-tail connector protein [Thermincola ferriacetica]
MGLVLITPPASEPVTVDEAKQHLRVDGTEDDAYISNVLIPAAREYCEGFQNRAYVTQTWQLWLDQWPETGYIAIPKSPLQSVVGVKYYGTDDAEYIINATDYFVDNKNEPGRLVLAYGRSWPTVTLRPANGICVEFEAGYGDIAKVPQKAKHAMLMLIGHWFENREAALSGTISREIEFAVHALLWQDRVVPI